MLHKKITPSPFLLFFGKALFACLLLFGITFAVFFPVKNHSFLKFDTPVYVSENTDINSGLTQKGFERAFRFSRPGEHMYFHPFALVSHMVDCELFGLSPGAHHLMNLLYHILNTFLLFLLLFLSTKLLLPSLIAAVAFGVHPVQLESIAWIAERKNLLSTFFWLMTLIFYRRYTIKNSFFSYLLVIASFLSGLLSKPMLVTLPFTLLLLDFWPLKRVNFYNFDNNHNGIFIFLNHNIYLLIEKIPFFIISFIYLFISIHAADLLMNTPNTIAFPLQLRIANALISYKAYLVNFFWPFHLSIFYPYPLSFPPVSNIIYISIFLVLFTFLVISQVRRLPYLFTGWFWFIGTLVPVLGITQQGLWPAYADRWLYVPMVGILFILFGAITGVTERINHRTGFQITAICACLAIIFLWGINARLQLPNWKNQKRIFEKALRSNPCNYLAHYVVGEELFFEKNFNEALLHFQSAKSCNPNYYLIHFGIGRALLALNKPEEAILHIQNALSQKVDFDSAYFHLGMAYYKTGKYQMALVAFKNALKIQTGSALYHNGVGVALLRIGHRDAALHHFQTALSIDPKNVTAKQNIDLILSKKPTLGSGSLDIK